LKRKPWIFEEQHQVVAIGTQLETTNTCRCGLPC